MKKQLFLLFLAVAQLQGAAGESLCAKLNRIASILASGSSEQKGQAINEIRNTPGLLDIITKKAGEVSHGARPPATLAPAKTILAHLPQAPVPVRIPQLPTPLRIPAIPTQSGETREINPYWLHTAAQNGDIVTIRKNIHKITPALLASKNSEGYAPLHLAIIGDKRASNNVATVQLLLDLGANLEERTGPQPGTKRDTGGETALQVALKEQRRPSKRELRTGDERDAQPVDNRFIQIIHLLLARGADLNALNNAQATPIDMLAGFLHDDLEPKPKVGQIKNKDEVKRPDLAHVAQLLLSQHDANGNRIVNVNMPDSMGNTPLHWAAIHGFPELIDVLLSHGAAVNAQNNQGQTPIMKAAQNGFLYILKQFIRAGANVNMQDFDKGRTPLHWVQRMREGAMIKRGDHMTRERALEAMYMLLEAGANPTIKDKLTEENTIPRSVIDWGLLKSPWGWYDAIVRRGGNPHEIEEQRELILLLNPKYTQITGATEAAPLFFIPAQQAPVSSSTPSSSTSAVQPGWWQEQTAQEKQEYLAQAQNKETVNGLLEMLDTIPGAFDSIIQASDRGDSLAGAFREATGI